LKQFSKSQAAKMHQNDGGGDDEDDIRRRRRILIEVAIFMAAIKAFQKVEEDVFL